MTDPVQIKLHGVTDTRAAFRELREYISKNALRRAVRAGANLMLDLIRSIVRVRTGKLRDNLSVRVRRTSQTIRARVVVNTRGKVGDSQNAFYWRFLEKGWRTLKGVFKQFPFAEVAFNARKEIAAQQVVDEVDKAIQRAEKRARRSRVRP